MSLQDRLIDLIAAIASDIKALATGKVDATDPRLTNARTPTSHTHAATDISNSTAAGRALMTAADAPAARSTLGLANHEKIAVDSTGATLFRRQFGYASGVGAGAGVEQSVSKSQAVGLNNPTGTLLLHGQELAAGASASFLFYNAFLEDHDHLVITRYLDGLEDLFAVEVLWVTVGGAKLRVKNITAYAQSGQPQIKFAVIKGAAS